MESEVQKFNDHCIRIPLSLKGDWDPTIFDQEAVFMFKETLPDDLSEEVKNDISHYIQNSGEWRKYN